MNYSLGENEITRHELTHYMVNGKLTATMSTYLIHSKCTKVVNVVDTWTSDLMNVFLYVWLILLCKNCGICTIQTFKTSEEQEHAI